MAEERPWSELSNRYGSAGESVAWREALEHYYWDRLDEAVEAASALGVGTSGQGGFTYRMIEAEALTRERAVVREVSPWLTLEFIRSEVAGVDESELAQAVLGACDELTDRLLWTHGPATRVTILAIAADAPWTPSRHGFCVDKHPYDKICLPHALLSDRRQFVAAVRHEYAHVITLNLSQGRCPRWLDEAVAMVAEGTEDWVADRDFASGRLPWPAPEETERLFLDDRESRSGRTNVYRAYRQSAAIGAFLVSQRGEPSLGVLLRQMGRLGVVSRVVAGLQGVGYEEPAMRRVYRLTVRDVFAGALERLRERYD